MERRYEVRKQALMQECRVPWRVFNGALERLRAFAEPFVASLCRCEQAEHTRTYMEGLLSDLERKNVESIAYRHDQDRQALQHFIGAAAWDHRPLLDELTRQVGQTLGVPDAVLIFDPSGFKKSGHDSVGVERQWLGRLGKIDNGQVGVYLSYASRKEHVLVDMRLYLPRSWATDKKRRKKCGVPKEIRFATRHQLSLEMLDHRGPLLPHAWVAGDVEMGRSTRFRRDLRGRKERYLLAVPCNTAIRDLEAEPPPWRGCGSKPKRRFEQAQAWAAALPESAWTRIDVRDGHRGPLVMDIVTRRVQAKTDTKTIGPEELLVVTRRQEDDGTWIHDYYLSNASPDTPLAELARVAKAEHRVEDCFQRAKSEAGLADYEVRTWTGWYHHQTLSLLASWFLVCETSRGKKIHTCSDGIPSPCGPRDDPTTRMRLLSPELHSSRDPASSRANSSSTILSLATT